MNKCCCKMYEISDCDSPSTLLANFISLYNQKFNVKTQATVLLCKPYYKKLIPEKFMLKMKII